MDTIPTAPTVLLACPRGHCGGDVVPYAGDGRFFFYKSIFINLPATLVVPRCVSCKQDYYLPPSLQVVVNEVLEAEYKLHEGLIEKALASKKKRGEN